MWRLGSRASWTPQLSLSGQIGQPVPQHQGAPATGAQDLLTLRFIRHQGLQAGQAPLVQRLCDPGPADDSGLQSCCCACQIEGMRAGVALSLRK